MIESYSAGIIENVSDAILVFNKENRMRIFNSAAEALFGIPQNEALNRSLTELLNENQCEAILSEGKAVRQISCRISGSTFMDSDDLEYAIGTIVQQLRKDFVPKNHQEEYSELTGIVYGEVRRINQTIQEFLRFSRPEPILPFVFKPGPLIEELKKQYETVLEEKQIKMEMLVEWH